MSSPCPVNSLPRANLTDKQYRILTVIVTGNGRDDAGDVDPVDMTELLDRLSYRTSKDSMQFSIRALVKHGLVEKAYLKRRGATRAVFKPTHLAAVMLGHAAAVPFVEPDFDLSVAHA